MLRIVMGDLLGQDLPECTSSAATRSGCPGSASWVGCLRDRAAIAVFSSTDNTNAFTGRDRYKPHTSAARSQNARSCLRVSQPAPGEVDVMITAAIVALSVTKMLIRLPHR